jgi:Histone chaperone domain CHZ
MSSLVRFFTQRSNVWYIDSVPAKDDNEAIDQSNIIEGRTRGAKPSGGYTEPGDEEGLPGRGDSGASAVAGGPA